MPRKIIEQCPSCGGHLEVTRLSCTECETIILGRFESTRFTRLSPESLLFLEIFVKNRGNIKKMERELNDSYWTIRARLDDVIKELGFEVEVENEEVLAQRRQILERLDRGEIGAAEAAEMLSKLKEE
jgi:hypothetical protein